MIDTTWQMSRYLSSGQTHNMVMMRVVEGFGNPSMYIVRPEDYERFNDLTRYCEYVEFSEDDGDDNGNR